MKKQQRNNDKRVGFPDISDSQAVLLWGKPGEKPLGARTGTNNKLSPPMTPGPGIETEPHWWEASALTTAPSLLLL